MVNDYEQKYVLIVKTNKTILSWKFDTHPVVSPPTVQVWRVEHTGGNCIFRMKGIIILDPWTHSH